jgi:DNA adenine methylase
LKLRKVKTHGGKWYLARKIIERLPGHRFFVEPFAGGLSVLLNKPPAAVEVASDRDARLIGFYRELQSRPDEFLERVLSLEYDRETFAWSLHAEAGDDPLESAIKFLVRRQFSRGALGRDFAWSDRLRGGQPGDRNAWHTLRRALPAMADRLRHVELRCQDAFEVIREHDGPSTLFYLDPPYLPSTRTAPEVYHHEMSAADHARLIDIVTRCRGRVALSGYGNALYDQALSAWERVEFSMPNHASQSRSKQRRIEVLWLSRR